MILECLGSFRGWLCWWLSKVIYVSNCTSLQFCCTSLEILNFLHSILINIYKRLELNWIINVYKNFFWHNFIWIVLPRMFMRIFPHFFVVGLEIIDEGLQRCTIDLEYTHERNFCFFSSKKNFFAQFSFIKFTSPFLSGFFLVACFHRTNNIFEVELIS